MHYNRHPPSDQHNVLPPTSGPYIATQPLHGHNRPYSSNVNTPNSIAIPYGTSSSHGYSGVSLPPPSGPPVRRPFMTDSSHYGGSSSYNGHSGYAPPPPVGYQPPAWQQQSSGHPQSRPPELIVNNNTDTHATSKSFASGTNYDSDVSSMATPVATPDASARYRNAFSPNECADSPPPPALSMDRVGGSYDRGPVPPLQRPKSFLAIPMTGDMEYVPSSNSNAPPPLRARTTSASSVHSGGSACPPPCPPPGMSTNSGAAVSQCNYKDASTAMHNIYNRNIQQPVTESGSPGSRGKDNRRAAFFPPSNPSGGPDWRGYNAQSNSGYSNNSSSFMAMPGSPPGSNFSSGKNRIDPSKLPRPLPPPKDFVYHTRAGVGRKVPPVSNAVFQCIDTGNCSPRYLRVTTCAPPTTSSLAYKLGVPLALVATPFARPENGEDSIEVVEMIADGQNNIDASGALQCNPIRCSRCKSYMNPFVKWLDSGRKWSCNLCHMLNETPSWYYCSLDGSNQRVDKDARPELCRGSVDFAVNSDYCVRPPQESIFIFCIDVSERAVTCGLTTATMQAVAKILQELQDVESPAKVGIVSFSRSIQFYSLRAEKNEPFGIYTVNSADPFCPLPEKLWIIPVQDHVDILRNLIWRLPELHSNAAERDTISSGYSSILEGSQYLAPPVSCPLATLVAAADGLKDIGGKIFIFTPNHSVSGVGTLTKNREYVSGSVYGTPAELGLYGCLDAAVALLGGSADMSEPIILASDMSPTGIIFGNNKVSISDNSPMECFPEKKRGDDKETLEGYLLFADWCGRHNISTDVYITTDGNKHKDIALFAEITRRTGGSLHPISGSLLKENSVFMLQQELSLSISSLLAAEAVLKLRCSAGFRADDYIGQGRMSETATEAEIAWLNDHFTFVYTFVHESNMKEEDPLYLQLAILYTSVPGRQRLVRVHNIQLVCTAVPAQVFRSADLDCVTTALIKSAVDKALKLPLNLEKSGPREFLTKCLHDILYGYRTNCSTDSPKSQLILPDSLKVLPMYVMAMLKHPALLENISLNSSRGGSSNRPQISGAERSFELSRLQTLPVRETILTLYPRLFALHSLEADDGTVVEIGPEEVQLPRSLPCSSEIFDSTGMYLLDDGMTLWLYIGRNMPIDELDELFDPNPIILPPDQRPLTEISFRTDSLTDYSLPRRISNIISGLRRDRTNIPDLKILWADAPHNAFLHRFSLRLVEDSIYGNMSYVDYLVKTHAKIQARL